MKGLSISLFLVIFIFGSSIDANAQRDKRSDKDDERSSAFYDNFWWGANAGLQFTGGNQSSFFLVSLEPMLGYKLDKNGNFSVGPRLSAEYTSVRYLANTDKVNSLNFGGGLFARAKVYRGYFAHVEYEKVNQRRPTTNAIGQIFIDNEGQIQTERNFIDNYFIGGGIRQGGDRTAFEILILFNLNQQDDFFQQQPVEYRTGFTVNF